MEFVSILMHGRSRLVSEPGQEKIRTSQGLVAGDRLGSSGSGSLGSFTYLAENKHGQHIYCS